MPKQVCWLQSQALPPPMVLRVPTSITRDVPWVYHGARSVSFPSQALSQRPLNKSYCLTSQSPQSPPRGLEKHQAGRSLPMEVSPPVEAAPSFPTPIAPIVQKGHPIHPGLGPDLSLPFHPLPPQPHPPLRPALRPSARG